VDDLLTQLVDHTLADDDSLDDLLELVALLLVVRDFLLDLDEVALVQVL